MNTGIICEFNPFHKGHKYLIDSMKKEGADIICVMSGNFVQRGEFAVYDKFTRAKAAVENGADLVIELPTRYSTLSAQGFARAGVYLLESTGVVDSIAFGAECDDVDALLRVADEIKEKDALIKEELKKGVSYPKARQNVIGSKILEGANNILALEYLSETRLKPFAVKRIGKGHDTDDSIYSASSIRKTLSPDEISTMKNCERAILYILRTMTADDFVKIEDVSEGLENRIADAVKTAKSLDELYDLIKTKRYTHSRIRRIILRSYLNIYNENESKPSYIRILAFNGRGRELLSEMKKNASLPVITSLSDARAEGGKVLDGFLEECRLTDIYNLGYTVPRPCCEEQRAKLICL